jgi:hypothetical protein
VGTEEYRDSDGTRLLLPEEVAARCSPPVDPGTIRKYNADAKRLRKQHRWTVHDLPKPRRHVNRRIVKGNGRQGGTRSPLFREDEISVWLVNRRGPGGRVTPAAEPEAM